MAAIFVMTTLYKSKFLFFWSSTLDIQMIIVRVLKRIFNSVFSLWS